MEPATEQVPRDSGDSRGAEFFIPDLCAPRSVLVMILLAELMVVVHVIAVSALPRISWDRLATASLFVQWVVLLSAALLCQLRAPFSRLSLPLASFGSLLVVLAVTVASSYLAYRLLPLAPDARVDSWLLLRNVLVATVLAGVTMRYFYLQQQLRLQEQLELQSRLDSLRSRIRPHFLFNTLNSIASLIMSRPEAAEQAVEDLSELFRSSLTESDRGATVADELRLCELYLDIERLRLGDRLSVQWQVAEAARQQPMPSLVLQPLVENAIYHGISLLPGGGTVVIAVAVSGGMLTAVVENPMPPQPADSRGHRMALDNIRERLAALYGPAGTLQAGSAADRFRVELRYPTESLA